MKKVLFSIELFFDAARPELGPCVHQWGVVGSLASSGMGVISQFNHDSLLRENGEDFDLDKALVGQCETSKPDMLFATHIMQRERNVKGETYGFIRDELKIPVVIYWCESAPDVVRHADEMASHVTLNLFTDSKTEWQRHTRFPEKCLRLFEPRDATLFACENGNVRDIPLTFLGSAFGRLDRSLNLGLLAGRGMACYKSGGQAEARLDVSDYAALLRRSLVTLNFTSAVTFQHITGRTVEAAMCGAMLLESENDETPELLDPYADYVPFEEPFKWAGPGQIGLQDPEDLIQKALYYSSHPDEAHMIAENGRRKALERCDGREFWRRLFEAVRIK